MKRVQLHGGDLYRHPFVTDFSVNTNPLGPPKAVLTALKVNVSNIDHYPDVQWEQLTERTADWEGVAKEHLIFGNGAAELIFAAVLARKPARALLLAPTFAEYERALQCIGAQVIYHRLLPENGFCITPQILPELTSQIDMLFLCNPNNPTGELVEPELLLAVLERCRNQKILCILDECFLDFLENAKEFMGKQWYLDYPNLLILKAFTKIFSIPGVRLGYGICQNQQFLQTMSNCLQPWNVSVLAQIGGNAALENADSYLKHTLTFLKEEKPKLVSAIQSAGYKLYGSHANYLFFHGEPGLYQKALEEGFLIRDCSNYRGLQKGYYRIAVRSKDENMRMIQWLRNL